MDVKNNTRNSCIDAFRVIAIFMVVIIHKPFLGYIYWLLEPITKIAVSIFFMISGYYCLEIDKNRDKIKNQAIRIFKYFIYGSILYLIWNFMTLSHQDFMDGFSLQSIAKLILINNTSFGLQLWFLSALFYSLIFVYLCSYLKNYKIIYSFIPILFLFNLILGNYSVLIFGHSAHIQGFPDIPHSLTRNWIFFGVPFVLLGNYIYITKDKILSLVNNKLLIVLAILFGSLSILEKQLLCHFYVYTTIGVIYIGTVFFALSVFLYLLKNPQLGASGILEFIGRKYVLTIYIIHFMILQLLGNYIFKDNIIYKYYGAIIGFFASLIVAVILNGCINYSRNISKSNNIMIDKSAG